MVTLVLCSLLLVNGLLVATLVLQHRQQRDLIRVLRAIRVAVDEIREAELRRAELLEKQALAERAVETGSIGVETVHKAIAGLTFGILEAIPTTRAGSTLVRGVHDATAAGTYEAVRKLNREVGKLLKEVMDAPPPAKGPSGATSAEQQEPGNHPADKK